MFLLNSRAVLALCTAFAASLLVLASCDTGNSSNIPGPGPLDDTDPVINSVSLAEDDTVSGSVAITASASDNIAVTSFTLKVDGTQVDSAADGNFSYTWDTTSVANGERTLVFTASDAAGNTDSQTIHVTVNNSGDTTDPVIDSITGVAEDAEVSGAVAISASASDDVAVTSFTLSIDGTEVASSTDGSLAYNWDTATAANGERTLVFTASDAGGNSASQTIHVNVNNGGGGGGNAQVSGIVYMPNGTDPVSGALVFVRQAAPAAVGDPPSEPYEVFDYTDAAGAFSMTGAPTGSQTIKIIKGAFVKTISVNLEEGENVLGALQTTLPAQSGGGDDVGKMLVVTGDYDAIENVLAKLGLGEVDGSGALVLGTETFDLADGANKLDDTDYPNFDSFITTPADFDQYRTIFLNCGNHYEDEFFASAPAVDALRAWVEAGGRLYCTDWSYDFCEQLFPAMVDFASFTAGDGFAATPELHDEAQSGADDDLIVCHSEDSGLTDWASAIGAASVSGDFDVIDWLPGWAAIEALDASVKVWATGTVTYGFPTATANKPVTISFSAGEGTVLFSSYHTEGTAQLVLNAQDRVLQYLIFEVL